MRGESGGCCFWVREIKKNVASGRGLAVQLREKRKKFKGRAGCAVEGQALGRLRWVGGGCLGSDGFRFRVCFVSPFFLKLPPPLLFELWTSIYR